MTGERAKFWLKELQKSWEDEFGYMKDVRKKILAAVDYAISAIDAMPDSLTVKINTHGNPLPVSYGEWTDLYSAEDVTMKAGEFRLISLGVSMELPRGYYAKVVPRSSTCKKWGIMMANSIGIIENSYNGDGDIWGFPAVAIRDTDIPKGTRICQFCVCRKEEPILFEAVESLNNENRGGFGSTGE